ncbi:hypothetical protein C8R45DRAFT_929483 [Mycena sanguinolenta]|nr:hypothetical protein C8R45DRAFT_929483 [Mycena sanguinolenta]
MKRISSAEADGVNAQQRRKWKEMDATTTTQSQKRGTFESAEQVALSSQFRLDNDTDTEKHTDTAPRQPRTQSLRAEVGRLREREVEESICTATSRSRGAERGRVWDAAALGRVDRDAGGADVGGGGAGAGAREGVAQTQMPPILGADRVEEEDAGAGRGTALRGGGGGGESGSVLRRDCSTVSCLFRQERRWELSFEPRNSLNLECGFLTTYRSSASQTYTARG